MSAPPLILPGSSDTLVRAPAASHRRRAFLRKAWLREPLLHFVLLGGALFGLDRALLVRADDPRTIVVSADVDREVIETFRAARNRYPDAGELKALRQAWLDNEVLYREGLALQVDKGDPAIRERVIFKALSVVDSSVKLPPADEAVLRKWFQDHRDKYDEPGRFDFEEAVLTGGASEPAVVAFARGLNSGVPGDARAGLRVFKGRPQANLVQSYGPEFVAALAKAPPGLWQALKTRDGWRAIRLNAVSAPRPARFEAIRNAVWQDWTDAVAAQARTAAVRAWASKYTVKYDLPAPVLPSAAAASGESE